MGSSALRGVGTEAAEPVRPVVSGPPFPRVVPLLRLRALVALAFVAIALTTAAAPLHAQGFRLVNGRNHPELDWRVAETAHVRLIYPARLAGIELEAAPIAEASYAALTRAFGVTFDAKIPIYLSDEDEIVNGTAYPFFEGYTTLWAPVAGVADGWTGREKWLRKVIAHELAHVFHYRATRSNLGLLGRGFGNGLPRAWTEGLAQYLTERWDTFRGERYLRTAALEGRLGETEGASAWAGRLLYAGGHSHVRTFAQTYGDSTLRRLLAHRTRYAFGLVRAHDLDDAFRATVGVSYGAFLERWRRQTITLAGTRAAGAEPPDSLASPRNGRRLTLPATVLDAVVPSPVDSGTVAVVRLLSLARPVQDLAVVTTGPEGRVRVVAEGGIEGRPSWSPDGRRLAYTRSLRGRHGSIEPDVFVVDVTSGKATRVTRGRRASMPTFSPDGARIAFVVHDRVEAKSTARVVLRTLATGAERVYETLGPDTQAEGLAWQLGSSGVTGDPDGVLAVSLFGPDGTRAIHRLALSDGRLSALTDGAHDDRTPVFSPDGHRLAFTSLRDNVPNAFVLTLDGGATSPGDTARVTRVAQGATVTGWSAAPLDSLTADSATAAPAAGHLLAVVSVSKAYDAAYRVRADRRVAPPVDVAPAHLSAWERRPPGAALPWVSVTNAQADSLSGRTDASAIVARSRYRSLAEIRHVATVPFPYLYEAGSGTGVGVGAGTVWFEPLGKHQALALVGLAPTRLARSYALLTYQNATLEPTITVDAYHFPSAARVYGTSVLSEREAGVSATAAWPINLTRAYAGATVAALARLSWSEVLNADDFTPAVLAGGLPLPEGGTQLVGGVSGLRRTQKPWRDAAIHPLDGTGVRLAIGGGVGLDRRSSFVRSDAAAYAVLPSLGLHRLYVYGRATAQAGRPLAQDYVGLARYDGLRIALPAFIPLTLERNERVRGYRSPVVGNVVLFGSMEYRVPLVGDLQTSVLGLARFGAVTGALFVDAAAVGRTASMAGAVTRVGVGAEVKNVVHVAGLSFGHALGVAQPAAALGSRRRYETYYRIQFGVPF